MPITTKVVSLNPVHGEVCLIQHDVIVCQWLRQVSGFLQVLRFSDTNKTDRHDITEILLKVALNTINLNQPHFKLYYTGGHLGFPDQVTWSFLVLKSALAFVTFSHILHNNNVWKDADMQSGLLCQSRVNFVMLEWKKLMISLQIKNGVFELSDYLSALICIA